MIEAGPRPYTLFEHQPLDVPFVASPKESTKHPIVDSLIEIQAIQSQFAHKAFGEESSPFAALDMIRTETDELEEALHKGDKAEIASEVADVFLVTFLVAEAYQIPMEIAVSDKMARNAHKYNPFLLQQMREQGVSPADAMATLKQQWDRNRDKTEFCRVCGR